MHFTKSFQVGKKRETERAKPVFMKFKIADVIVSKQDNVNALKFCKINLQQPK